MSCVDTQVQPVGQARVAGAAADAGLLSPDLPSKLILMPGSRRQAGTAGSPCGNSEP